MKKTLLFHVGQTQYGIALPLVKDIKSAKPVIADGTESGIRFTRVVNGTDTPLYDLVSVFTEISVCRSHENEKLIMVEHNGRAAGMVVSGVNQVVSIAGDRIKPLSPIFKGLSKSCFANVLKHEGSLVLLLTPEGIINALEEAVKEKTPLEAEDGGLERISDLLDMPDTDEDSHCESASFLANLLQSDRGEPASTEPDGL